MTDSYEGKTLKCTSNQKLEELIALGESARLMLQKRTQRIPRAAVTQAGKPHIGDAKL